MSELTPDNQPETAKLPVKPPSPQKPLKPAQEPLDSGSKVAIALIVVIGIVSLCCIVSCAAVAFAFVSNPPW
jgi:hypothetical protein